MFTVGIFSPLGTDSLSSQMAFLSWWCCALKGIHSVISIRRKVDIGQLEQLSPNS